MANLVRLFPVKRVVKPAGGEFVGERCQSVDGSKNQITNRDKNQGEGKCKLSQQDEVIGMTVPIKTAQSKRIVDLQLNITNHLVFSYQFTLGKV